MIRWVIFDLDMTLLDTFEGFYRAFVKCVEEHGRQPPPDFASFLREYEIDLLKSYVPQGVEPFKFWRRCWSIYVDAGEIGKPIPGMPEIIGELRREGRIIMVATGREMDSQLVMREMEAAGIAGVEAVHALGDLRGGTKLDLLRKLIGIHNIVPKLTAYVTDAPQDVAAGKAVGFHSIGFASWTDRFPAAPVARDAKDVMRIIRRLDAEAL